MSSLDLLCTVPGLPHLSTIMNSQRKIFVLPSDQIETTQQAFLPHTAAGIALGIPAEQGLLLQRPPSVLLF